MIGERLLRYSKDLNLICFDVESTSLNLIFTQVWQLGYLIYEDNKLVKTVEDWIKWPGDFEMSKDAARITGWTKEEYERRGQDPVKVLDKFEKYYFNEKYLLLGANIFNFDVPVINSYRRMLGRESVYEKYLKRCVCVQSIEKAIELQMELPKIGTSEWVSAMFKLSGYRKRGLKTNLAFLAKKHDVTYDENRHHFESSYDCSLVYEIFKKQCWKLELENI